MGIALSARFVRPLLPVLSPLAIVGVPLVDRLTMRWVVKDLDLRAARLASAIERPVVILAVTDDSEGRLLQVHDLSFVGAGARSSAATCSGSSPALASSFPPSRASWPS
jgi:hypothetical protein